MYDLIGIGNPVYDEILTPYSCTQGRVLSGCSTNVCLAARRLGLGRVALIGSIGRDYEQRFRRYLSKWSIEHSFIKVSERTGGFRLIYNEKGERTLDVLAVADRILPEDIPAEYLKARMILLGPILREIDLDFVGFLRENSNAELFLDPQGMVREIDECGRIRHVCERNRVKALLKKVDIVKPNESEAVTLTGSTNPYISARTLVTWGAKVGIVTLAEKGSILYNGENFFSIPAYQTLARDPTGAGDVYAGAFISKYLEGQNCADSALFASAAASIKVEHSGPDFPMDPIEVNKRMIQLQSLNNP